MQQAFGRGLAIKVSDTRRANADLHLDANEPPPFDDSDQRGWLTEVVTPLYPDFVANQIEGFASSGQTTGYGSADSDAETELAADVDALVGHLDPEQLTVTRLYAELPRTALSEDLNVEASPDQSLVNASLTATVAIGTEPTCPDPKPPIHERDDWFPRGSNCNLGSPSSGDEPWLPALTLLGLAFAIRQRRRRSL
jgi:MYXO-CTERM domain-containing protein